MKKYLVLMDRDIIAEFDDLDDAKTYAEAYSTANNRNTRVVTSNFDYLVTADVTVTETSL